jgi:hypothetical protein
MIKTKDGKKRLLKAEEIECRVGQQTKDKSKYSVLLYKTARTDMDILDEIFGIDGWQVEYHTIDGKLFCNLGVFSETRGGWIWKESNGAESNIEAEKGQASDALKRAGFMVGIGRELYSAPKIWLDSTISPYDLEVSQIEYDESDKICTLVLSAKGKTVYQFGKGVEKTKVEPQGVDHDTLERIRNIVDKLEFEGKNLDDILKFYGVKTIAEIPLEKWEKMLAKVRGV